MRTPYQFLLIGSPPKKEAAFKTAKAKFGSTFAFQCVCSIIIIVVFLLHCYFLLACCWLQWF